MAQRASEEAVQKVLANLENMVNALGIEVPSDTDQDDQKVTIGKVASVKAKCSGHRQITISWNKVKNATGYKVYQYNSSKKKWNQVKNVTGSSSTIRSLTVGKTYKYKVRAYYEEDGKVTYGAYSKVVSAKPVPAAVRSVKAVNSDEQKVKLTWKKASGVGGYVVYRSSSANGKYKAVKTLKEAGKTVFTNSGLTEGKTYYYKVRSYNTVKGKKVYSDYSSVVKVTVGK